MVTCAVCAVVNTWLTIIVSVTPPRHCPSLSQVAPSPIIMLSEPAAAFVWTRMWCNNSERETCDIAFNVPKSSQKLSSRAIVSIDWNLH